MYGPDLCGDMAGYLGGGEIMRRMRKQPVGPFNERSKSLQSGDRAWHREYGADHVVMIDVYDSHGRDKAASGELSYRVVKKNGRDRSAVLCDDGLWYWCEE